MKRTIAPTQRGNGRRNGRVGGMAAALLVAARLAAGGGAGGQLVAPAAGAVLRAGEVVTVRWAPVARGVEELELLLSLDAGRTFPLRLTAMLDPSLTSYAWRVPNLPSRSARLQLRVGIEEREVVLTPGPEFSIAGDRGEPTSRVTFWRGEWWPTVGVACEPPAVEAAPRWMEGDHGGGGVVPAVAFSPQHPDLGAAQATTPAGRGGTVTRWRCPQALALDGLGAVSFPKRE